MISVSTLKDFGASEYLGSIAKVFGITEIAKVTEINREKLYRALKKKM